MKRALSILIPTYNDDGTALVEELLAQAAQIEGLQYEVLIGDDGSTDEAVLLANQHLATLPHCTVLRYDTNRGRAAIRNTLAAQAQYEWLLFIDGGHMRLCKDNYLQAYLTADDTWQVVYGGYELAAPTGSTAQSNLRYKYELRAKHHAAAHDFQSANFLVHASLFQQVHFDERFVRYGYEDVLLGKAFAEQGVAIHYIDNPTLRGGYEDNATFLRKTEEALHTLKEFEKELQGYSRLLSTAHHLTALHLAPLVTAVYRRHEKQWRANLSSPRPSLRIFTLFRLSLLLSL